MLHGPFCMNYLDARRKRQKKGTKFMIQNKIDSYLEWLLICYLSANLNEYDEKSQIFVPKDIIFMTFKSLHKNQFIKRLCMMRPIHQCIIGEKIQPFLSKHNFWNTSEGKWKTSICFFLFNMHFNSNTLPTKKKKKKTPPLYETE